MSSITASSTAAYFTYIGHWSSNTNDPGRRIWRQGDSVKLHIQGSALYLYGDILPVDVNPPGSNDLIQYNVTINKGQLADPPCLGNATAGDSGESLICKIPLDMSQPTDLTLSLVVLGHGSSGLNLSRIEWTDPNFSTQFEKSINASSASVNSAGWTTNAQDGSSCTISDGLNMAFTFEGTSIVVKGMATAQNLNANYRVMVDGTLMSAPGGSDRWVAYASQNQVIDLYRQDGLKNASHTVSFSDIQPIGQICVLRADISFPAAAPTPAVPSSAGVPSPSVSSLVTPSSNPRSTGNLAGIVIGALVLVAIIVGGALFLYRRRNRSREVALDAKKLRYCSKCGAAITDRYRMECVQAELCVQDVDLHVKCQDWNTPTNHSHSVHKVLNG